MPKTGTSNSKIILGILGVFDSVTDSGPPENNDSLGIHRLYFNSRDIPR